MLTKKQRDLLLFIIEYQDKNDGVSPTYREMAKNAGQISAGPVHHMVDQLIQRGFITRMNGRARALKVEKLPDYTPVGPETAGEVDFEAFGLRLVVTSMVPEGEVWMRGETTQKMKVG